MANLHKSRYAQGGKNNLAPRQVLKDRNEETFIASGNMVRSANLDSVDSNSWQAVSWQLCLNMIFIANFVKL